MIQLDNIQEALKFELAEYRRIAQLGNRDYPCLRANWDRDKDPIFTFNEPVDTEIKNSAEPANTSNQAGTVTKKKVLTVNIRGVIGGFFGVDPNYIMSELSRREFDYLKAYIDTPGGTIIGGLSLFHGFMQLAQERSVNVYTINAGMVGSAGVMPFLAGSIRVAQLGTSIFTHAANGGAFIVGDLDDSDKQYNNYRAALVHYGDTMLDVYSDRLNKKKDDAKKYFKGDNFFNSEKAKSEGFATTNDISDVDLSGEKKDDKPDNNNGGMNNQAQNSIADQVSALTVIGNFREQIFNTEASE